MPNSNPPVLRISEMNTQTENGGLSDRDVLTAGPKYNEPPKKTRIRWYRCRVTREALRELNRRSDFFGSVQTLGFLGVLAAGAGAAIYASRHWPWYITALLVFINGHFWHFSVNGFHELVHDSVFKTRWLNRFSLRILSFLGWHNHHLFWASHTEHHKYTLHPPDDGEVVLPQQIDLKGLWKRGIVNYKYPYTLLKEKFRNFTGYINAKNSWIGMLFPESDPERRRAYTRWERVLLIGHLLIAGASVAFGYWIVPLVITFPKMFGSWLHFLCNSSQHVGVARQSAGFSPLLPHDLPQPLAPISLLAHELSHRAPHVRRGAVLQTRAPAQADQTRDARLPQRLARNLEANRRDIGATGTGAGVSVRCQTTGKSNHR